jgi:hypothetical protein
VFEDDDDVLVPSSKEFIREFNIENPFRIQAEKTTDYYSTIPNRIYYNKGRYWMSKSLMHGMYVLNNSGVIPNFNSIEYSMSKIYFFIEGIMMDNRMAYIEGLKLHSAFLADLNGKKDTDIVELEDEFCLTIARFSRYPVAPLLNATLDQCTYSTYQLTNNFNHRYYTGRYNPLFTNKEYEFNKGDLIAIKISESGWNLPNHVEGDYDLVKDYLNESKTKYDTTGTEIDPDLIGYELLHQMIKEPMFSPFLSVFFLCYGLDSALNERLFIIHYLRDFHMRTMEYCLKCNEANSKFHTICSMCKNAKIVFDTVIANRVNYYVLST